MGRVVGGELLGQRNGSPPPASHQGFQVNLGVSRNPDLSCLFQIWPAVPHFRDPGDNDRHISGDLSGSGSTKATPFRPCLGQLCEEPPCGVEIWEAGLHDVLGVGVFRRAKGVQAEGSLVLKASPSSVLTSGLEVLSSPFCP